MNILESMNKSLDKVHKEVLKEEQEFDAVKSIYRQFGKDTETTVYLKDEQQKYGGTVEEIVRNMSKDGYSYEYIGMALSDSFSPEGVKHRKRQRESFNPTNKKSLNETLFDAVLDRANGFPYNPREFYHYVNGFAALGGYDNYDRVAHAMDELEDEDVADAIIDYLRFTIDTDGGNPDNPKAKQLYDFVRNSTWLTSDRTAPMPQYLKDYMAKNESLRTSKKRKRIR